MFDVGDWVRFKSGKVEIYGFIDGFSKINDTVFITKVFSVRDKKRVYYEWKFSSAQVEKYRLEPIDADLIDEDLNALIDLSLDTKDREWFLELTKRMEGIKRNGSERSGRKAKEVSN
ncbi:hypothetical protein A3Q35_13340 [Aeribacillus pallidus]|uniref:IDEAL domain-containing protein n=1 Tax=Aeribacillus pallidus TaxID=33936 RepID=UPI0007B4F073|nr:IDEAL domain-containing protein [Aeribacillus pallidus]KZM54934.1 hypothetical protein A3Q35_13340 [Aeribacillus pallidus]